MEDKAMQSVSPGTEVAPRGGGRAFFGLIGVVLIIGVLYFGRELIIPVALVLLLSFILSPLVRRIERLRIPRIAAVGIVVTLTLLLVGGAVALVVERSANLATELPQYQHNLISKVRSLRSTVSGRFDAATRTIGELGRELRKDTSKEKVHEPGSPAFEESDAVATQASATGESAEPVHVKVVTDSPGGSELFGLIAPVVNPLVTGFITLVLLIFFLIYREDLRDRLLRSAGQARITLTTTALADVSSRLTRYLVGQVVVNSINGLAIFLGLLVLGVPNAPLWGVMAALLRFVPFLGPWIAAFFPIAMSIAVSDGWTTPVMVAGWFLIVDLLSNNLLEPFIYGSRTGVSPVAIILTAIFWTWLWGPIGLLLSTPITVCLVVLGRYVPQFEGFYILLSDAPVLEPHARLYQRLLAMDRDEVRKLVEVAVKNQEPAQVFDTMLAPAMAAAEADRREGMLDKTREEFIVEMVEGIIEELGALAAQTKQDTPTDQQGSSEVPIAGRDEPVAILAPSHGPFDVLVAQMVKLMVEAAGRKAEIVTGHALVSEVVDRSRESAVRALFVTVLVSDVGKRVASLERRLLDIENPPTIVVGAWVAGRELERLRRIGRQSASLRVCESVEASVRQILESLAISNPTPREEAPAVRAPLGLLRGQPA